VGCGSSRILRDLPGVVGLDISFPKLRYMSRYGVPLVQASIFALPFADGSFQTVVCSEVIEHVPGREAPLRELARVNRKGGTLVLGTPDYARFSWRAFEAMYRALAPGGYADEHITQYTHESLRELVVGLGYRHVRTDYVAQSEMILVFERT
jgi:ubiquinone/menaquinone biosynthesis C-methylase UbiE